ncbi:KUP/HAK/KT family potassium transporter [Streptomyces sp. NPDC003730]
MRSADRTRSQVSTNEPVTTGQRNAARSLFRGERVRRRVAGVLAGLGIFGASLSFGDGMITPAISVLSAAASHFARDSRCPAARFHSENRPAIRPIRASNVSCLRPGPSA